MSYTKITKDDFENFLGRSTHDFFHRDDIIAMNNLSEHVYSASIKKDFEIVIFSSISTKTGKARAEGDDAIRLNVTHDATPENPVWAEAKTLRTHNWESNLQKKIKTAVEKIEDSRPCPDCGNWLVRKEGNHGEFYGCVSYPECENTENI